MSSNHNPPWNPSTFPLSPDHARFSVFCFAVAATMAAQTCFSGCCLPLKQLLSGPTPRTAGAVPDCSPWGPSPEVDLIPSHDRPRVGSWASPVPSMPAPWGTWEMVEGDLELRETPPAGTVTHLDGKPRRISRDAIAGAQPGRLQDGGGKIMKNPQVDRATNLEFAGTCSSE